VSTRVYTETLVAGLAKSLPQGRFFYIASATAALDIELARRNSGNVSQFQGVGAGLKYNGLDSDRWYEMRVTSAVPQVITVYISDDAEIDVASTVSIAGAVNVSPVASSGFAVNPQTVTNVAAIIAGAGARRRVLIQVPSTENQSVFVGGAGVTVASGLEIQPGQFVAFDTTAAISAIATANTNVRVWSDN
jgi:hypothetical protein